MRTGRGETAKRQLVSHILYINDPKLYGRNPDQLKMALRTIRNFSNDIQMNFSLEKCAFVHIFNGKLSRHNSGVTVGKTTSSTVWNWVKSTNI